MTIRVPAIEKKAEDNMRKWVRADQPNEGLTKQDIKKNMGPYIALARETGAGGSELAKRIARRLQWDVLDQEIVDYLEEHYGTPRCLLQRMDERHENWLSQIITSQIGGLGFSETTYTHRVTKLLLLAASHGNVIIVGRGARFILPRDRGLSVRIVAPLDFRVEQVILRRGINEKEAHRYVVETDRQREKYLKSHFGKDGTDSHLYDLVVNVEEVTLDDAVDLIVDATEHWLKKHQQTTAAKLA